MAELWNDPGELARQYAPAVYRLAYARTGCRADAEDVMQEVFLRLIKAGPTFAGQEHAKAWLLRVTSNCANTGRAGDWERDAGGTLSPGPIPDTHPPILL